MLNFRRIVKVSALAPLLFSTFFTVMPAAQVKADAETTAAPVIPVQSKFFSTAYIEDSATYNGPGSNGDLWPTAWADDGSLYGANGDGTGFGSTFSDYPDDSSAGSNKTYQFTFDKTWGDGIRIVGMPGGTSYFTSIGEMEVYFSDLLGSDTSSEQQSANLVKDPGFEDQTSGAISSPWAKEGNAGIDRGLGYQNSGSNNAWIRYNSGWNDIKQQIAVEPNHNYILKGYLRTSSNNTDGYFGVRTTRGAVISEQKYGSFATYTPVAVHFNSGANSTIEVYAGMWANNGDTWVQIDDVSVTDDVPAVMSSSPLDGAVDVPVSGNIVVTLNQDIQAGDVTGITLKKGSTVTDFVYGINGNALTITPSKPLLYNSTYTVTIPAGAVKNASNSSMNTDYSFSFTTAKPNDATP